MAAFTSAGSSWVTTGGNTTVIHGLYQLYLSDRASRSCLPDLRDMKDSDFTVIFSTFHVDDIAEIALKSGKTPILANCKRDDFLDVYEAIHAHRGSHPELADDQYDTFRCIMSANLLLFGSQHTNGDRELRDRCRKLHTRLLGY